jgi:ABC-2 type transport system ATP-binding protein
MALLEVKDLSKHYGKTQAVDGISFEIQKGEIFGFLGPNGAGKTTTIRCIMNFLKPSGGVIKIDGRDSVLASADLKKKIGYLPADVSLYKFLTGKDHIQFIESIQGKSKIVDDLVSKMNFDVNTRFHALSTGNKRKLGLILSLMYQPELIILDEPTAGLDPILQNAVYEILEDFQKKGSTIFMSSHNLAEVDRICDRVGIIKDGKLVATEGIQALKDKKIHVATIHFVDNFKQEDFIFDGVSVQEILPDGLILDIKGDLNPLINKLGGYKLKDLEISHASLEEVFLEYYHDGRKETL